MASDGLLSATDGLLSATDGLSHQVMASLIR